jgi:Cu/Ag efflux pump CusA
VDLHPWEESGGFPQIHPCDDDALSPRAYRSNDWRHRLVGEVAGMRWALGSSLRFSRLIIAVAIGVMVFGIAQLRSAPVDVYPEFTPPAVEIQAEALGLSAAEVEQLITVPLEQDLLNGVPWLDRIHSSSMPGLSAIDLTFQPGTNLYAARQMVQERMTQAHALPNVGSPPVMIQPLASASRVAMFGL